LPVRPLTVAVLIDLPEDHPYHVATLAAIDHARAAGEETRSVVLRTRQIGGRAATSLGDAIVVGPGSPYVEPEAVFGVIASARENGVPLVGT
jgi:hypothetical protein